MKHPERIEDYLEHIVQAIARATSYVEPLPSMDAFQRNPQAQDAVIRNIEIIGEAATKIQKQAPEFVKAHSELPWSDMRGMRNKVIHHYFDRNLITVRGLILRGHGQLVQTMRDMGVYENQPPHELLWQAMERNPAFNGPCLRCRLAFPLDDEHRR